MQSYPAPYSENMPTLYRNIMDGMPSDFARDAFLWAVERPGEDRFCYRAEKFAREADRLIKNCRVLIEARNWTIFRDRLPATILDDDTSEDLVSFIMKRHANFCYGGNLSPSYC